MEDVVIIGSGVVGLCTAYYLREAGHSVVVLDKSTSASGASYINAGYICPSHLIPLAAPGVVLQGLKWMFNPKSPLFIKPSLRPDFLRWAFSFMKSANQHHVDASVPVIRDLSLLSRSLYDEIYKSQKDAFHLEKKGLLMLCQTENALEEERHIADIGRSNGLDVTNVTAEQISKIESGIATRALGGTYYKSDWHMTPSSFMIWIKQELKEKGVKIIEGQEVSRIESSSSSSIQIKTNTQDIAASKLVIAAGVWSAKLCKSLGINIKLVPGKGYSINIKKTTGLSVPSILVEKKIATTPMNGFTRVAGTMEIGSIDHIISKGRVTALAEGMKSFYPDIEISTEDLDNATCGLRPVSSDGLPYIGETKRNSNILVATGHGMMGWSTATGTGKIIQELIDGGSLSMDISRLRPER